MWRGLVSVGLVLMAGCTDDGPRTAAGGQRIVRWKAAIATEAVATDPDDPAIWIHPEDPSLSLVIATNKAAALAGAVIVFDLEGKIVQTITGIDRPNNVDLRQQVAWGDRRIDLVAVTERFKNSVRMYSVDARQRRLTELGSVRVFDGEAGDYSAPMGIALYRRPSDGAAFAIVGRKNGPAEGYLWQYQVGPGPVLEPVRRFGKFSGQGEIEAIVADDAAGYVYYADEGAGIRKYRANADGPEANQELALFGTSGYRGDREGLAIYTTGERTGYLISTDQIAGGSRFLLYRREGSKQNPHDHSEVVAVIEGGTDDTDGIEATSISLGRAWPRGMLAAMNSGPRNYLFFSWQEIR